MGLRIDRFFGDASRIFGGSWSPSNPAVIGEFQAVRAFGLPASNSAEGIVSVTLRSLDPIIKVLRATAAEGNPGGAIEFFINISKLGV
jgi:hypothetical protein